MLVTMITAISIPISFLGPQWLALVRWTRAIVSATWSVVERHLLYSRMASFAPSSPNIYKRLSRSPNPASQAPWRLHWPSGRNTPSATRVYVAIEARKVALQHSLLHCQWRWRSQTGGRLAVIGLAWR